ncbi:hypothetical protein [Mycolicibacter kumamotonensis]|uniref:Uncharacterized protein n=1 Tax=Mycolicibacter kumamotonensis TaxID=354243 RepID=A0A1B8SL31_9MYCO|nr:hypothetical protein [Mycolicibacter kumamotonensis]OBY33445.1 hypothetical protein ACT18_00390 [Mycolicibacter kumamotonensis]
MRDVVKKIARVHKQHLLVHHDRRAWWCQCGDDCLSAEGSHAEHVASQVINALKLRPELSWRVGDVSGLVLDDTDADDAEIIASRYVTPWEREDR